MAQIQKGVTYSTLNATVTIENLNQHVDNATLLPGAISDQVALAGTSAASGDEMLMLASGQLKRATVSQVLGGVTLSNLLNKNNNLSDLTDVNAARTTLSISNVENKSSATIRSELTSANVTTALGYTPATAGSVATALQTLYPVGSVYINASSATNPGTLFGFGTWVAFGEGRVLLGTGTGAGGTYAAGSTGGSKDAVVVSHTHTFTGNALPTHSHLYNDTGAYAGGSGPGEAVTQGNANNRYTTAVSAGTPSGTISTDGVSGTNANLPPYITVYMWQRTA